MKYLIPLLLLTSCVSTKNVMNSWIGHTKHDLYMTWGPPAKTDSDGADGEVLVYATQTYSPYYNITLYQYKLFYVNKAGVIYHWVTQSGRVPPQQLSITLH